MTERAQTKRLKEIGVIVVVLVLLGANVFTWSYRHSQGYGSGYVSGSIDGFEIGHVAGHTEGFGYGEIKGFADGYDEGETVGYEAGETDGFRQGYSEGQAIGYSTGSIEGYRKGEREGYDLGHSEGQDEGWDIGYIQGLDDGAGRGWTLRDPSYSEMQSFLRRDRTDQKRYVKTTFNCENFALETKYNAMNEGYFCYYVAIDFEDGGHALIAFNTTDRGLKYVEPQDDNIMKLKIGEKYWPRAEYRVTYDDTVTSIKLIP